MAELARHEAEAHEQRQREKAEEARLAEIARIEDENERHRLAEEGRKAAEAMVQLQQD